MNSDYISYSFPKNRKEIKLYLITLQKKSNWCLGSHCHVRNLVYKAHIVQTQAPDCWAWVHGLAFSLFSWTVCKHQESSEKHKCTCVFSLWTRQRICCLRGTSENHIPWNMSTICFFLAIRLPVSMYIKFPKFIQWSQVYTGGADAAVLWVHLNSRIIRMWPPHFIYPRLSVGFNRQMWAISTKHKQADFVNERLLTFISH